MTNEKKALLTAMACIIMLRDHNSDEDLGLCDPWVAMQCDKFLAEIDRLLANPYLTVGDNAKD